MKAVGIIVLTFCLLFGVTVVTPVAQADHCTTKINVFGRSVFAPVPVAPYSGSFATALCPRQANDADEAHALPPQTDQIYVRIHGDFGPSIPTVRIELDGLGFQDSTITLNRTANDLGGHTYSMRSWAFVPAPQSLDELVVTAFYPDGPMRVTYQSGAFFAPLPAPPVTPSVG